MSGSSTPQGKKVAVGCLLPLGGAVAAWLLIFLPYIRSGFSVAPLDALDGRFVLAVHEHWFNVLRGREAWDAVPVFWPLKGTLGMGDGFLGTGIIYSCWRFLGLDPFASTFGLIGVMLQVGYWGAWLAARRCLGLGRGGAAMFALLFACGSLMHNAVAHSHLQLLVALALPWLAVLAGIACRPRSSRGSIAAAGAGMLLGLLSLTGVYVTWYLVFYAGVLCLVAGIAWLFNRKWGAARSALPSPTILRLMIPRLALFTSGLAPFAIAFLWLYLPVNAAYGNRTWNARAITVPSFAETIYQGENNWMWRGTYEALHLPPEVSPQARSLGFGPIFLSLFFVSGVSMALRRHRGANPRDLVPLLLFTAACVCLLLNFRIGSFTPWRFVHEAVPGASAVRMYHRFNYVLLLPMLTVVAHAIGMRLGSRRQRALALVLGAVLLLEGQPGQHSRYHLPYAASLAELDRIPPPPADARVFYIRTHSPAERWQYPQLDAMHVALRYGLTTLNGYSGIYPHDWWLYAPDAEWYPSQVRRWLELNKADLQGLYELDWDAATWRAVDL